MTDDIRNRLKVERERLADLEDDLASAEHAAATGEDVSDSIASTAIGCRDFNCLASAP